MFEYFQQHQLYIVLGVILLVWAGIIWYLFRMDGKIRKLEEAAKKG